MRKSLTTVLGLAVVAGSLSLGPAKAASDAIQGGVKKAALKTGMEIKEMGTALRQLKHAGTELYGEMTRQEMVSLGEPDVIGTMVIPAIPAGPIPMGGYLPPRKEWVNLCMSHMTPLVPLVKEEIDDISPTVHPDSKDEADPVMAGINNSWSSVQASYQKLQTLTASGSYDNAAIANESVNLIKAVESLDKQRKQLWKAIKNSN